MSKPRIYTIPIIALLLACAVQALGQTVAPKQDEPKLIATLQNASASLKDKVDACRQLAIIGGKDSIAPLAALLGDEKLSHMARYALEPNPDPAVDQALRDAMGKIKGGPLVGVVTSLGVRRDAKAVPAMSTLLSHSDVVVACAAARALGTIGTAEAGDALQKALSNAPADRRLDFCEGLFRCAEGFTAQDQKDKAVAIYDQLRALDSAHQVRAGALRGAILSRGRDGLALLTESLQSKDYILFSAAVQTSQAMPGGGVTKALLDALKDLPTDNQILVIQAIALRNDTQALSPLLGMTQSGPTPVRLAAIDAVTEMGNFGVAPVLVKLLDDPDKAISAAARDSLAAFRNNEADSAVMDMFNSGDAAKRLLGVDLIGQRRMTQSFFPVLLGALRDDDPKVRQAAIKVAGDMASADQMPAVLNLLERSETPEDLEAAEQALMTACTKIGDSQATTRMLVASLNKKNAKPAQKAALLRVLAAVGGPDALKAVRASLDSTDADVRSAAIRALSTWKTTDAAPDLLRLAKDAKDPGDRTLAVRGYLSLAGRGDIPVEERLTMAQQAASIVQRDDDKRLLLGTLGGMASPEALKLITPYLEDTAVRQEAALAIVTVAERFLRGRGQKDTTALIEPLEKVMQLTSDESLLKRAKIALQRARGRGQ